MTKIKVVIDAFRAFATASYVLQRGPKSYVFANSTDVIVRLAQNVPDPLLIGKSEQGQEHVNYDIPNSPTRVEELNVHGRHIFHRTEAGAKGVLRASDADLILVAGFVNAKATAECIFQYHDVQVELVPMGHEAVIPTLEDDLCGEYIEALLAGKKFSLIDYLAALREGPGRYFFGDDQWQYPREDFDRCLKVDGVDFAIEADVRGDYALLQKKSLFSP